MFVYETNYSMKNVMRKAEMLGRMANQFVQVSTYELRYEPMSKIKSQAVADFMADFHIDLQPEVEKEIQWLQDTEYTKKRTLFTNEILTLRDQIWSRTKITPRGHYIPCSEL